MTRQGQSFEEIRDQCLGERRLFEDPDFPAVDTSVFYSKAPPRPIVWKRPSELVNDPKLFVEGATRFDVKQGQLGNDWLVAAVASLCGNKQFLNRVVPQDQGFGRDQKYAGIFHFQFWQYGKWTDVIVDDRLPTVSDRLVFMHSDESNEFWSTLLEKAYAKLVGSYEALKGGATNEAMVDFTGGVTEIFDLRQPPANLITTMLKANQRSALMGCSIEEPAGKSSLPNGLITGNAYSITAVQMFDTRTTRAAGEIPLVRVRNPMANEREWNGPWSDKSREWTLVSESERVAVGLTYDDDGEFWMSFQDFSSNFQKLEICNLGPDSWSESGGSTRTTRTRWEATAHDGSWRQGVNAGGCRNFDTFWVNPQYRVQVVDPDEDDDDNMGTIIVSLMQKERRAKRKEGLNMLVIGYYIYKLTDGNSGQLDRNFFKYNESVDTSPPYINKREVCERHKLPPGNYCIIPSTFDPDLDGDFLLRIFSEKPVLSEEVDDQSEYVRSEVSVPNRDPDVEAKLRATFDRISGKDMEIDAYELQAILYAAYKSEFTFDGFSIGTSKSMVAMLDLDMSGKLGFEEFRTLWDDLREWKDIFKKYDSDSNGIFSSYELRNALSKTGFKLSNSAFRGVVLRYSNKAGNIEFDEFILCLVRLKTMLGIFNDHASGNTAEFTLDTFIGKTTYS